jgi:hypothetical protein
MEGMRVMLADRDEVWKEFRLEPDEFVDGGDRVVVIGRWVGKGKGSGIEVQQPKRPCSGKRDTDVGEREICRER